MSEIYADSIEAKVDGTNQIVPIRDITKAPAIIASASGESIQLSDSADAPLTDMKLYGKSKQDGEPSPDNPVEIEIPGEDGNIGVNFAGKNMVPYPYENGSITVNGITFTVNDDGSILINGTATNTVYLKLFNSFNPNIYAGKYFYAFDSSFTASTNSVIFRIGNVNDNTSIQDLSNGVKINPSNKIGFLGIRVAGGYTANNVLVKPFISPEQNYNYNDYISPIRSQIINILTPNGLPGIPVTSGGNYTDEDGQQWISDYVDFKRKKYVQMVKKIMLSSSMSWSISSNGFRIYTTLSQLKNAIISPIASNYFIGGSWNNNDKGTICLGNGQLPVVGLSTTDFETAENLKSFLDQCESSGNPVYLIAPLNSQIETDFTPEELEAYRALMTYYPNTNITTDTDPQVGMEVEYTADTKTYIDNKMSEIQTQLLNMKTQEV